MGEDEHLGIDKLKDFIQNLATPMGFGKEYEASDIQLEDEISQIPFMIPDSNVPGALGGQFDLMMKDIAEALAKRVQQKRAEEDNDEEMMMSINLARTDPLGEKR